MPETSLVLRCCRADMTSRRGFQWPSEIGAVVEAPDWQPTSECGHGLHGWAHGQGDVGCCDYWQDAEAKWLVLEVETAAIVMLGGKCKFPRATVRFAGARSDAADFIAAHSEYARNTGVIGHVLTVADNGCGQVGALGSLTGGDGSTLTGGYGSTLTGGYGSTLTGGDNSTLTGGAHSTLTGGDNSTLTGGYGSELRFRWWDGKAERYRTALAYVGEGDIKADVAYRIDATGRVVEAEQTAEAV